MDLFILKQILIIFALSTLVNFIFTKIKIPTIVGYLLTGILAGPHLLALISAKHEIELLAEIGVILLLFTIGLEFSLTHLLKIRKLVFFGGLLQVSLTVGVFYVASNFYDLSWQSGLFIGFLSALSSSAIVLKLLQERSELTSNYGRTTLGILIFQDILLVPLLLFANLMGGDNVDITREILILSLKTAFIIGFVYVGSKWLLPMLLHMIAKTRNQELFMMSILLICLTIALLTYQLGMSLAFGAFLAGLMISNSQYSHSAFSNIVLFKDTFTSFFFVSIGMLLDLNFVIDNYQLVIISVVLVIVVKSVIAGGTGFIMGHTFRGTIVVGLALSQVGEFSFILAKIGQSNAIISDFYYQLFLAVAVITMALTPFLMRYSLPFANLLMKLPLPKILINGIFPLKEVDIPDIKSHLVIIGTDKSALSLSLMAKLNNLQQVSIVFDPMVAKEKLRGGDLTVYGDAVNEPILLKAHVETADIVIVSIGNLIPTMTIVEKVRRINPNAYIIVKAKNIDNLEQLYQLGADQILPEKLEIAIDLFTRILVKKSYPQREVSRILTHIRHLNLGKFSEKDIINPPTVFYELRNMSISAIKIEPDSEADRKTLLETQLRSKTGVTLVAIKRDTTIIEHPEPDIVFKANDIVYVLGKPEQVNLAYDLFSNPT
ncbi:Kef-type potassium/proton antiporter, CPA2 family [Saccharicrinis carchari]|uniref:Kef-type potassium/proton antiporter, CPA2 family n=1 Tax=Saccharicrinis carchari TaxID=1168039 RepID=A0A521F3J1_SACCC|nr:cation:proton antiporter [Saccharicrinis carchari]SMO90181.1 Kef-type potassium/proton antiporter, CPA2 family [Saccharicrinis carchari]